MSTIESPCINVCVMDAASGTCRGCGRTLAEIGAWRTMSSDERRAVMERLAEGPTPTGRARR